MRKLLPIAVLCVLVSTAQAGEVNGPPKAPEPPPTGSSVSLTDSAGLVVLGFVLTLIRK
jgi:hypothetical protein